jgi:hypothetical protein
VTILEVEQILSLDDQLVAEFLQGLGGKRDGGGNVTASISCKGLCFNDLASHPTKGRPPGRLKPYSSHGKIQKIHPTISTT